MPIIALTNSPYLFTVPPVNLTLSVVLTPASYATWTACFSANPTILEFLLTPGNYRSWGTVDLYNRAGGSAARHRIVRYYAEDAGVHPVLRGSDRQAYVEGFKFSGPLSSYWAIQGVWINDSIINCGAQLGATNCVIDYNVVENCGTYGIRMNATQNSYVQRNVIRDMYQQGAVGGDTIAVQFKNVDGLAVDTVNNFLLDNQIYNCGDSVGHTESVTTFQAIQTTIDGNCCYIEPSEYIGATNLTVHENAGDFKAGSDDYQTVISNNRAWGFRRNNIPTASGEAWVIQKYFRNVLFENNITGDCPRGMKDENWPAGTHAFTADAATDILTDALHNLPTGGGPLILKNTGGTPPGGTNTTSQYWAIYVTANTFKLALSRADALAGTAVDITSAGTGTNSWKIDPTATRSITVRNNQWYDIRDYATVNTGAGVDAGAVWKPITNMVYENNTIARSTYLCDISPTTYYAPTFTGNTLIDVTAIQRPEDQIPALPYNPALNSTATAPFGYVQYERKRWTGPELADSAIPATESALNIDNRASWGWYGFGVNGSWGAGLRGLSSTSVPATTGPYVQSVRVLSEILISVRFSEAVAVNAALLNTLNYHIVSINNSDSSPPVVRSVQPLRDKSTSFISLRMVGCHPGETYLVTVYNVTDTRGNVIDQYRSSAIVPFRRTKIDSVLENMPDIYTKDPTSVLGGMLYAIAMSDDLIGGSGKLVKTVVSIPPAVGPTASFSHSSIFTQTTFTDLSSPGDAALSFWFWQFGDSITSSSRNPVHAYASSGTYSVTLTTTDVNGLTGTYAAAVSVTAAPVNLPPVPFFTYVLTDTTAAFTDGSSDSDGTVVSRLWDFGDGDQDTATNPSHTYVLAGTYTVTLTATDNSGVSADYSVNLVVTTTRSTIVTTVLTSGNDLVDRASYSTLSVTPTANALVLAWFASAGTATVLPPTGVTGNGMTWVQAGTVSYGTGARCVTVFRAMSASPTAGVVTFDLPATMTAVCWGVIQFTGVNQTGANGSGAVRNTTSVVTPTALTAISSLPAFDHPTDVHVCGIAVNSATAVTVDADFVSQFTRSTAGSPQFVLHVETAAAQTDCTPTWATFGPSGAISLEIKSGGS